jgi:hypothetical protein
MNFYFVLGLLCAGALLLWLLIKYAFPKIFKGKKKQVESGQPVYARIRDNYEGHRSYNKWLSADEIQLIKNEFGDLGGQWKFRGQSIYCFCRDGIDHYIPYNRFLNQSREFPPIKLYKYVSQPEIKISRNLQSKESAMEKYGHLIPFALGMGFIIFMIVASR